MSNNTILFFSSEPGGAEVLVPVIQLVQSTSGYSTVVLSYGPGAAVFEQHGIPYVNTGKYRLGDFSPFDRYHPQAVITSASSFPAKDMSEKYLWHDARLRGIPSIAFLDVLQGYHLRFCDEHDYEKLIYFPDFINCINEVGREELLQLGIESTRLVVFGHPFQSEMKTRYQQVDTGILRTRTGYGIEDTILLFVSQPIEEYYGDRLGYTQYTTFQYFLDHVAKRHTREKIILKLHPKENRSSFQDIISSRMLKNVSILQNEISSVDCILIADLVFGMYSTMLTQAYVLEKPVVSFLPGSNKEEYFMTKYDYIPCLQSFQERFDYDLFIRTYRDARKPYEYHFDKQRFASFVQTMGQTFPNTDHANRRSYA